jgi:transposase-like protein
MTVALPADVKAEAYRLYLYDNLSVKEIAAQLNIKKDTLAHWISKNGDNWVARKKELMAELMSNAEFEFMKLRRQRKLKVANEDLEVTNLLIKRIRDKLTAKRDDGKLKYMNEKDIDTLCKALKSATDVRHRIVGINDRSLTQDEPITGRSAMFLVGMTVKEAQQSKLSPKVIEVQEVQHSDPF